MNISIKIILKSGKDQSLNRFHPWIFSGAIKKIIGNVQEGDLVEVVNNKDEFLAIGHYQIGTIAVRVISFDKLEINTDFWKQKILDAYNLRNVLGLINNEETNVYRLVNAEGDGMPGLIIDHYNGVLVMQMHSIGFYLTRNLLVEILKDLYKDKLLAIYNKSESTLPFKANISANNEFLFGNKTDQVVSEYGLKFNVSWLEGQKTGFFIDQRENRKLLDKYSLNKAVLNVFGYTGGFSIFALHGKAKEVHSVDSSKKAIDLTEENVNLNYSEISNHKSFVVDAFEFLKDIKDKYDVIVLDPPAFAKHRRVLHNAIQGYKKINRLAIEQIKAGGILFTFSCSQVLSKQDFQKMIFSAAAMAGREVKILHHLTQPADHPVSIYHPEGEYLKGLVLYVK